MSLILGIDPGSKGAIAWTDGVEVHAAKMGETVFELSKQVLEIVGAYPGHDVRAYLEKVHSMPKQGVSSSFTFGRKYGNIEGILASMKISVIDVIPQRWVATYPVGRRGDYGSITLWKKALLAQAERIYPNLKLTQQVADAVLILHYGLKEAKGL